MNTSGNAPGQSHDSDDSGVPKGAGKGIGQPAGVVPTAADGRHNAVGRGDPSCTTDSGSIAAPEPSANEHRATGAVISFLRELETVAHADTVPDADVLKALRRRRQRLRKQGGVDASMSEALDEALRQLDERRARASEQQQRCWARLDSELEQLESMLDQGQLREAIKADIAVRDDIATVAGEAPVGKRRRKRLAQAEHRLREMRAWRDWGTTVAREELIREIESLPSSGSSPVRIAETIRRARATWRDWDRSGDPAGKALWERFNIACSDAYQICREHFAQQARVRDDNRKRRETFVAEFERRFEATDWSNPDWREIDKFVHQRRRDWNRLGHVDRKLRKSLNDRFRSIFDRFEERLRGERSRNLHQRRLLLERVASLADSPAADIEEAKRAQTEWKVTVRSDKSTENELWASFRAACDALFERHDTERRVRATERERNTAEMELLCRELESLAQDDDKDAAAIRAEAEAVEARRNRLGPVDRGRGGSLERRFQRAGARVEKRARHAEAKTADQALVYLRARAEICSALESALAVPPEQRRETSDAQAGWEALAARDPNPDPAIAERYRLAVGAVQGDAEAAAEIRRAQDENLKLRRALCVQLEILAGIDSPPDCAPLRMQYQVWRLASAMGNNRGANGIPDAPEVRRRYWSAGGVEPDAQVRLDERFRAAEAALSYASDIPDARSQR